MDRQQSLFLVNNAKLEVQRSKAALKTLYRHRQTYAQVDESSLTHDQPNFEEGPPQDQHASCGGQVG